MTDGVRSGKTVWVSVQEAAVALGISEKTVYARIKRGDLERKEDNGRTLVAIPEKPATDERKTPTEGDISGSTEDVRHLLTIVDNLNEELSALREKWADERMRTDTIIAQLSQTNHELTAEVRQLRALPSKRSWWQRILGKGERD